MVVKGESKVFSVQWIQRRHSSPIEDFKYKSDVLLTWTCTRSTVITILTFSANIFSRRYSKEIPKNILTRHLSDITDVLDPEKLGNDLHYAGLVTKIEY